MFWMLDMLRIQLQEGVQEASKWDVHITLTDPRQQQFYSKFSPCVSVYSDRKQIFALRLSCQFDRCTICASAQTGVTAIPTVQTLAY